MCVSERLAAALSGILRHPRDELRVPRFQPVICRRAESGKHASARPPWEASGAQIVVLRDAAAGALAGVAVSLVLHPVDTLKVLIQVRRRRQDSCASQEADPNLLTSSPLACTRVRRAAWQPRERARNCGRLRAYVFQ